MKRRNHLINCVSVYYYKSALSLRDEVKRLLNNHHITTNHFLFKSIQTQANRSYLNYASKWNLVVIDKKNKLPFHRKIIPRQAHKLTCIMIFTKLFIHQFNDKWKPSAFVRLAPDPKQTQSGRSRLRRGFPGLFGLLFFFGKTQFRARRSFHGGQPFQKVCLLIRCGWSCGRERSTRVVYSSIFHKRQKCRLVLFPLKGIIDAFYQQSFARVFFEVWMHFSRDAFFISYIISYI